MNLPRTYCQTSDFNIYWLYNNANKDNFSYFEISWYYILHNLLKWGNVFCVYREKLIPSKYTYNKIFGQFYFLTIVYLTDVTMHVNFDENIRAWLTNIEVFKNKIDKYRICVTLFYNFSTQTHTNTYIQCILCSTH